MPTRPEIFISAASKDLKSCRQLVRDALLTLGCVPVVQDHFPPAAGAVREMLREKIAACDALIHLAGECYGYEPREPDPSEPRRSYTQMEYDIARELKKPLYIFLCAPDFPFDSHEPEQEQLRALQHEHRAALAAGDQLYLPIKDPSELAERIRELQARVERLTRDLQKTRSWLGRSIAATAAALLLIVGLLYGLKHRADQSEQHATQAEQQLAALRRETEAMRKKLDEQTQGTAQILAAVQRLGSTTRALEKPDFVAQAQAEVAGKRGISLEELKSQLAGEKADVRQILADIEKRRAAAATQVAEWMSLQREALTKLGDSESAAGHYAAAIEPYQQGLALCEENREPLVWCDTAQKLELALWQQGRYTEAEPLARRLVEKRTALQGAEHPDALTSINRLANTLFYKGDLAGADPLYRRCLEARERTLGKEHPDTLRSVNNLAILLEDRGDIAGAETLYRRALEVQERALGKEHPDTLRSINNLANLLASKGDLTNAESLYRRALEARERTLGKEHPDTLKNVNNLAALLQRKGDLTAAETLFRHALEAQERTLGKEHPDTLLTVNNLTRLLDAKDNMTSAGGLKLNAKGDTDSPQQLESSPSPSSTIRQKQPVTQSMVAPRPRGEKPMPRPVSTPDPNRRTRFEGAPGG